MASHLRALVPLALIATLFLSSPSPCSSAATWTTCPSSFANTPVCNANGRGCTTGNGVFRPQRFTSVPNIATAGACCAKCATDRSCAFWTFILRSGSRPAQCLIYDAPFMCAYGARNWYPQRFGYVSGGNCSPFFWDDPHFAGADGTHFDFSGTPGGDFCLIADRRLHINMHLAGYADVDDNNKNVTRTWVRALGILFDSHTILFETRGDANPNRENGFMKRIVVDSQEVSFTPGMTRLFDGGIEIMQAEVSHLNGFEQDNFAVKIEGLINMHVRVRSAGERWQRKDDSMIHMDVDLGELSHTPYVHGVLGQTYRENVGPKNYKTTIGFRGMVTVDGPNGDGYLDGTVEDYRTSGVLAADCKFASFGKTDAGTVSEEDGYVLPGQEVKSTKTITSAISLAKKRLML